MRASRIQVEHHHITINHYWWCCRSPFFSNEQRTGRVHSLKRSHAPPCKALRLRDTKLRPSRPYNSGPEIERTTCIHTSTSSMTAELMRLSRPLFSRNSAKTGARRLFFTRYLFFVPVRTEKAPAQGSHGEKVGAERTKPTKQRWNGK